jgi:hypothetical protein
MGLGYMYVESLKSILQVLYDFSEFMEGERGVVVEKGRQCQSKEAFSGGRKSAEADVLIRRSVRQCD